MKTATNGQPENSGDAVVTPIRLSASGLRDSERSLLTSVVRLSRRDTRNRHQPLELIDIAAAEQADVILVDARDADAMAWARQQPWISTKPAIWLDANTVPAQHIVARRPLQWPVLPILLSRAVDHFNHRPANQAQEEPTRGAISARVLVVDDSGVVRTQMRGLLERLGASVNEAGDVAQALHSVQTNLVDCVFMDVVMPGVDGYEGCREIKRQQRDRTLPVVMLTSKSSPFDRIRGRMAGCDAYLAKPVEEGELQQVLTRILAARRESAAPGLEFSQVTSA